MKKLIYFVLFSILAGIAWAGVEWSSKVNADGSQTYTAKITTVENVTLTGGYAMAGHLNRMSNYGITTMAPLAGWDCTLYGSEGEDLTGSALLDRLSTTAQVSVPYAISTLLAYSPVIEDAVTLSCSNMGTNKIGVIKFYVAPSD